MLHCVKKPRSSRMSLMCLAASLALKRLFQLGSGERDPRQFRNIHQIPSKWPLCWILSLWAGLWAWESAGSLTDTRLKAKPNRLVLEFLVAYSCSRTVKGSGPRVWKLRNGSSEKLSSQPKINEVVWRAPFSVPLRLVCPGHLSWLSDYGCPKLHLGSFLPNEWERVRNIKYTSKYWQSKIGGSDEFSQDLDNTRGSLALGTMAGLSLWRAGGQNVWI